MSTYSYYYYKFIHKVAHLKKKKSVSLWYNTRHKIIGSKDINFFGFNIWFMLSNISKDCYIDLYATSYVRRNHFSMHSCWLWVLTLNFCLPVHQSILQIFLICSKTHLLSFKFLSLFLSSEISIQFSFIVSRNILKFSIFSSKICYSYIWISCKSIFGHFLLHAGIFGNFIKC